MLLNVRLFYLLWYHVLIVAELDVGQLIKDPYFTLFESVGALEVSTEHTTLDMER
jgi:hypothetical protein